MHSDLVWILGFGLAMSVIALVGGVLVYLAPNRIAQFLKPLLSFAAGSLLGGALFFLIPNALGAEDVPGSAVLFWVACGFSAFFGVDLILEWHHQRSPSRNYRPIGPMILVADGLHNFVGGLAIGAVFLTDIRAGIAAWFAAAMHELPQELGDFGALLHAGYSRSRALGYNFISALSFPVGGVIAFVVDGQFDVRVLVALGAGNFIYIAASGLIPEVKKAANLTDTLGRFGAFATGVGILYAASVIKNSHLLG